MSGSDSVSQGLTAKLCQARRYCTVQVWESIYLAAPIRLRNILAILRYTRSIRSDLLLGDVEGLIGRSALVAGNRSNDVHR